MDDETHDDNDKQRRLDFLREKLTPISVERTREIGLGYLYEAMRSSVEKDVRLLDLFPPEFAEKIRKERSNG
jgi:hypothetical protein